MAITNDPDVLDKSPATVISPASSELCDETDEGGSKWLMKLGYKTREQQLLFKLDMGILSWACYGYFVRLLDTSNMTNAYVSGMKEELNLLSDEYNYFTTFWTIGYTVGMIPSQIIISRVRPSIWIPAAEVIWAVITFCFAAVQNAKQIYGMRFVIGLAESPFYVGAMTLLGNWYTPKELATRASLFYSASFAANMFSGYLQAAVYKGLGGAGGLSGWRWLFIMCGIITVPGALWGFFAVPDSPYNTRVWYLNDKDIMLAKSRMIKENRKPFQGIKLDTFRKTLSRPVVWIFVILYIFFCLDTYPLAFFAIYIKSLKQYSVTQINVIPSGAYAVGLVATILFGIISDKLRSRAPVAFVIVLINLLSCIMLATHASKGAIFFGYIINAATYVYGPLMITWLHEVFSALPDEKALIIGIAQTFGAAFNAWVPLFIFNTGTQAPLFEKGYLTISILSACQAIGVVLLWVLGKRFMRSVEEKEGDGYTETVREAKNISS